MGAIYFLLISSSIIALNQASTLYSAIPPPWEAALMARYVVHKSDWTSISTISTMDNIKSYPFVNLKSMSDGPQENGTGIPYMYLTDMDLTGKDIESNNQCTIMVTLAQSEYCKKKDLDPQDPRCSRVLLTGKLLKVPKSSPEYDFGKNALYSRHPSMKNWPNDHHFYVAKVNITQVLVLDFFGGIKHVSVSDYFNAQPNSSVIENYLFDEVSVVKLNT